MSVAEFLRPEEWLGRGGGPRYVQLRRRLEHGIETGVFAPNSSLPPEREIADITGGKAYMATDATELKEAFREIARSMNVVLTQ